jgi:DNA helicase-2/ATP-dependent DNA helicase PcrA
MVLRPSQEKILKYEGGKVAVSAVPGSGKTFTLSALAARLIADEFVDPEIDQRILIVTYTNSGVENFKAAIRRRLDEVDLPLLGFDVRTLHSLALEIIRFADAGFSVDGSSFVVIDELQSKDALARAIETWHKNNREHWKTAMEQSGFKSEHQWNRSIRGLAGSFIRTAKNERFRPDEILSRLEETNEQVGRQTLFKILAEIYLQYQNGLNKQAAYDFNDIIWRAVDLVTERDDLQESLVGRWPYVLEDEAQDSIPLQEALLELITGSSGNWVRVGDPNQAIMSTFTAADPLNFNDYLNRPDVSVFTLPNSGRSAPLIFGAANALLKSVLNHHPIFEIRQYAFRYQLIKPTLKSDAQPNPENRDSPIRIKVFRSREDEEIPVVSKMAKDHCRVHPSQTAAILVPTNDIGRLVSQALERIEAPYDDRLRSGGRVRDIAGALWAVLALKAEPLRAVHLVNVYDAFEQLGAHGHDSEQPDQDRFRILLRSISRPEDFILASDDSIKKVMPKGIASEEDLEKLSEFSRKLSGYFQLQPLAIDDLLLAISEELFHDSSLPNQSLRESDIALAYQIVGVIRQWQEANPQWRLPDYADQLSALISGGGSLPNIGPSQEGFEPKPGRITLVTQHGAKGMEWDAVFIIGLDRQWIPDVLDDKLFEQGRKFGIDLSAEIAAQLKLLNEEKSGTYSGRTPFESALIDLICERLRLFYVGITRARQYLYLSRSREVSRYNITEPRESARALGIIHNFLLSRDVRNNMSLET